MKKNVFALALCAVLSLSLLSACGGKKSATIKVGASPTPHAQILEVAKDILAKDNITLEIVSYDDYVLPNTNVEDGQLDANYFQHITYMNNFNEDSGTHLVSVAGLHYEPFGIYAGKTASLDALADGAVEVYLGVTQVLKGLPFQPGQSFLRGGGAVGHLAEQL